MTRQILSQIQDQRLQMILAPQLRQSLELLQLPVLELQSLIQQELEQNPTLEQYEADKEPEVTEEPPAAEEIEANKELDFSDDYAILSQLDEDWREFYQQARAAQPYSSDAAARREYFMNSVAQLESLQEHLMNQLPMAGLKQDDRRMGELLIGSITNDGYLSTSLEEIAASTGFSLQKLGEILDVIQGFDPVGVGAKDLRDCLLIQLKRLGQDGDVAAEIVEHYLDELGAKKYAKIAKELKITTERVQEIAHLISLLEPKPGRAFAAEATTYIHPEITIKKVNDEYVILMDETNLPHIRISRHYQRLMEDPTTPPEVKSYVQDKIKGGMFLIKSINQRQQTITRIITEIVKTQHDFFENGVSQLRPLTMSTIADKLEIHETTVSRAIANKYVKTPQGTYDLKYFFTSGYTTDGGEVVSNKAIKDVISGLIARENSRKPLSDQTVVKELKEEGYNIARRTVAKYRDELRILPSHLRKS